MFIYSCCCLFVCLCCSCLLSVAFLFLVEFSLLLGSRILVLLVLRHQIVHVALSFSELHFVHTFTSVPMQEGLSSEHSCELLADSLEQLLDRSAVPNECRRHLQSSRRNVANCGLYVVR